MEGLINYVSLKARRIVRTFFVCVLVTIPVVGGVNAAPLILWDFEGTVSAQTDDPLGIDGEVIRLHLEFDASDVWIRGTDFAGDSAYYFPTVVSSASITGVHAIATNSAAPAARYLEAISSGGISEALNNPSYVDFIIDGVLTTTFATNGPAILAPSPGDNLVIAHLRDDLEQFLHLYIAGVPAYEFTNQTITIKEVAQINIDIKPGNEQNVINPHEKGGIWVAILSDTDSDSPFDPSSQVDIPTVEFGPDGAKAVRHKVKDINEDGLGDLLLRFKIPDTGIACGDTEATLTGKTFDGVIFSGTDFIKTVGCKPKKCDKKKHHGKYHADDCDDDEKHQDKHKEKGRHDDDHKKQ